MFRRNARPVVITCHSCFRKAKPADNDVYCQECYDLAGIENAISDDGMDEAMRLYGKEIPGLVREILRKGGDRAKLYASFDFLPEVDQAAEPKKIRKPGKRTGSHPATRVVRDWCITHRARQSQVRAMLRKNGFAAPYGAEALAFLNKTVK